MPTLNEIYLKSYAELEAVHKRTLHFFLLDNKELLEREAKAAQKNLLAEYDKAQHPNKKYAVYQYTAACEAAQFFPAGVEIDDPDLGICFIKYRHTYMALLIDWSRNYANS